MYQDIVEPSWVASLELVVVLASSVKAQIAYNTKLNKMVHNFVDTEHHNVKILHHLALTLHSSFEKGCSWEVVVVVVVVVVAVEVVESIVVVEYFDVMVTVAYVVAVAETFC